MRSDRDEMLLLLMYIHTYIHIQHEPEIPESSAPGSVMMPRD